MSVNKGSGVLIVGGQSIGRYADLCISALDNVGKHLDAKPISLSDALSVTLSVDTHDWRKPLDDFVTRMGWRDIPMRHRRKVGPRRLRTVWVRPAWPADVDSCLERGEV